MNRVNSFIKMRCLFFFLAAVPVLTGSCKNSDDREAPPPPDREVKQYPERETKVYMGRSNTWNALGDPKNYPQWEYTRKHVCFYTNFIDMWVIYFQGPAGVTPQAKIRGLSEAFAQKDCFFETSMETRVNNTPEGYNNDMSDKRSIDLLQDNGFQIDYVSMNYMKTEEKAECLSRLELARTYKGKRKVFSLLPPWRYNGNFGTDESDYGKTGREITSWTDGVETDGPLGYWVTDQGNFRSNSYSIARYAGRQKIESAIMLAPYAAGVDPAIYDPARDFLKVSKECVLGHEDNLSAPDMWTIWGYNGGNLPNFPESRDVDGETTPVNSLTGVAFWLHNHLFNFPALRLKGQSNTNGAWTDKENGNYELKLTRGKTFSLQLELSNGEMPQIELSPVVRAITDVKNSGWDLVFKVNGKEVTQTILYDGGLNFIKELRLTKTNKVIVDIEVKAYEKAEADSSLSFEVMSNLSNTKTKKSNLSVVLLLR